MTIEDFNIINNNKYIGRRYFEYYKNHGYIPIIFTPYSHSDASVIASTICTECGSPGHASNMLVIVKYYGEGDV